jgi:flagellar hook-length control protein FliK
MHPVELGELKLELVVERDTVRAHLVAQTQQVQDVLERHMPRLREALELQGLKLDDIQVSIDSQKDGGKGFFHEHHAPSTPYHATARMKADQASEMASEQTAGMGNQAKGGLSLRI